MSYTQRITIHRPRRKRSLWGLGDPVTSPSDPSLEPSGQVIAGTVGPTRVACEDLPSDSPFRGPNGPCPSVPTTSPMEAVTDWLRGMFGGGAPAADTVPTSVTPMPPPAPDTGPPILLIAAAVGVGYYLYAKRKKKRSA